MSEPKKQNYLHGAAILAVGVVIQKILGAIYKIPIGIIIGDEGYSHFLIAYNIYSLFLTLATAGLPVALSRMISEANTKGRPMQARRIFNIAWLAFLVLGAICSIILYLFPTEFAVMLHDVEAAQSIRVLAPTVFFVCLTSAYMGYCQGHQNMIPTTIAQVLEVTVKTVVGLALAWYLVSLGKSTPVASAGAISGVTAGGIAAFIYMLIYKKRNYRDVPTANPDIPEPRGKVFASLVKIAIPISLGASCLALINLMDSSLSMGRLQSAAGFSYEDAKILYGVYGKTQIIYNLPAAIITPLTISIVPAIAASMSRGERAGASRIAENSLRIAAVIAMPMGVGLSVLAYPIMNVINPGSNAAGPELLTILGIASFFVCMALVMNAILQASGNEMYPVYAMIAGGLVKITVNWFLVANPGINIVGAPIGTLSCYIVMCVMDYIFICTRLDKRPNLVKILAKPLLACVAMGVVAHTVYSLLAGYLGVTAGTWSHMALAMVAAILLAVVVYFVAVIATRAVTADDMKLIPKGDKIAKLLKIR